MMDWEDPDVEGVFQWSRRRASAMHRPQQPHSSHEVTGVDGLDIFSSASKITLLYDMTVSKITQETHLVSSAEFPKAGF